MRATPAIEPPMIAVMSGGFGQSGVKESQKLLNIAKMYGGVCLLTGGSVGQCVGPLWSRLKSLNNCALR